MKRETLRLLLAQAARRLEHGYMYAPQKTCPEPTCFRCHVFRFLRKSARKPRSPR